MNKNKIILIGRFRYLMITTAIFTFVSIVFGGMQRIAPESYACPAWLSCYSSVFPLIKTVSLFSFLHLLTNAITGPLIFLTSYYTFRNFKNIKWIRQPLFIASGLLIFEIALGAYLAKINYPLNLTALHFAFALMILGAVTTATMMVFQLKSNPQQKDNLLFQSPFSKLSRWTLPLIFLVLVSGAILTNSKASFACGGWPLCDWQILLTEPLALVNIFHRLVVGIVAVYLILVFKNAWRSQRSQRVILTATTTTVVLYFSQAFVGAIISLGEIEMYQFVLHEASSAAVFISAIILFMSVGLAGRTSQEEEAESIIPVDKKQRAKDFLILTKPIIVLLLLFTTFAGMVIGARVWPTIGLTFWTILGGALAAGGAGAVNQYIDREIDLKMHRTSKRPIPSGRMTPAEGLAFGIALLLLSFYIMTSFVNLLAAMLSLAGMIYYIILYSILLKTATVQNIVIGGGAGAIPPMVGWAATTGNLDLGAWFLFLIVFMWTPPHFWALALVRTKEYAKAGIPMLPVVKGKEVTRWQIFIYTVNLVLITIMMYFLGLAGNIYLVLTIILGVWLLTIAWRVWKKGGNKIAYKMYRHSSMYLAFLFMAMMWDALL